ncbi:unnamed protein product [Clonostachys rosea f. rosea IK726]|uniref:Uncharacterized protein n=2 Tax=Bionectria ochroleuca TaxID=29856 RepID=A0A0B7K8F3_BIOOC|nr:unnamed protein product [Clonostachys rosea f. rosea IK726]
MKHIEDHTTGDRVSFVILTRKGILVNQQFALDSSKVHAGGPCESSLVALEINILTATMQHDFIAVGSKGKNLVHCVISTFERLPTLFAAVDKG